MYSRPPARKEKNVDGDGFRTYNILLWRSWKSEREEERSGQRKSGPSYNGVDDRVFRKNVRAYILYVTSFFGVHPHPFTTLSDLFREHG